MKKNILFIILIFSLKTGMTQDVTFTFANPQITNDGTDDFYEVDVLAASTAGFKMGAGLLYINYNTAAFGTQVFTNGNITFTYPNGTSPNYLLGSEAFPGFGFYSNFITNDNSFSRVAFSWQQALSSGMMPGNNVTATAIELFHMSIKYVDVNMDPDICFESAVLFTGQTSTACGGTTFADCPGFPGVQITNDNFDCSGASLLLPVELISFDVERKGRHALLEWKTAQEINNMGFAIERLGVDDNWEQLGFVPGQGDTDWLEQYHYVDESPKAGENYYRLKQMDYDGAYEYTDIRVVNFVESQRIVDDIFPNPSSDGEATMKIWNPKNEEVLIRVYDLSGRLHQERRQGLQAGWNGIEFALDPNQSSVYMIHLQLGTTVIHRKLIVSKK